MSEKTVGVTLVGAAGRMGLEIVRAVAARPDVRLIGAVERAGCDHIGADAGRLAGAGDAGVAISSDIEAAADGADVVVDFGPPEATLGAIRAAEGAGAALLVGTTGLDARDAEAIDRAARRIAVLSASNLSVGIAVMHDILRRAVSSLGEGFDVEIVEMHHRGKADAPSGTALDLARTAADARGWDAGESIATARAGVRGAREIGVLGARGGGVFGEHTAILASDHERLEITHRAASRTLFAQGAVRAASFLAGKPAGRYTMMDVLGLD